MRVVDDIACGREASRALLWQVGSGEAVALGCAAEALVCREAREVPSSTTLSPHFRRSLGDPVNHVPKVIYAASHPGPGSSGTFVSWLSGCCAMLVNWVFLPTLLTVASAGAFVVPYPGMSAMMTESSRSGGHQAAGSAEDAGGAVKMQGIGLEGLGAVASQYDAFLIGE